MSAGFCFLCEGGGRVSVLQLTVEGDEVEGGLTFVENEREG